MKQARLLLAVLLLALAAGFAGTSQAQDSFTVVIYNGLPGIFDDGIAGFQAEMAELGYVEDETITYAVATNGDELTEALAGGADLVVSIPGGIIFSSGVAVRDTPLLFIGSRDPVADRLVASLETPGGSITGVMVDPALEMRLDALALLLPEVETVYVVTDSSTAGTEAQVEALETLAADRELTLVIADAPMGDADAADAAVEGIPEDADAIFLINAGPVSVWPRVAVANALPLLSDSVGSPMEYGAVLAHVMSMDGAGTVAAGMADQILQGANPAELAVEAAPVDLIIDQRIADAVGVELPDDLIEAAVVVFNAEMVGELPPLEVESPASNGDGDMTAASGAACDAILQHPGGKNAICIPMDCEVPLDSAIVRYLDRVPADECPTEGLIGICSMEAFDMYHYDGEVSAVQRGCTMLQGEWSDPE